jgi:hypothetical protein
MADKTMFEILAATDCSAHVEKKETGKDKYGNKIELSYLSWAWAWDYFKKALPDAKYEIKHWEGKPYIYDEFLGFMVETSITAGGETHTMWLPVMDGTNSAMKTEPQKFVMKRKDGTTYDKIVAAATMFDINKTIMRCLVKNMAMFGLGLYIYAGEDLPSDSDETVDTTKPAPARKQTLDHTPTVEEIIKSIEESMTLDNCKKFYARAIELYDKDTPDYKVWVKVWADKKDALEKASLEADFKLAEEKIGG